MIGVTDGDDFVASCMSSTVVVSGVEPPVAANVTSAAGLDVGPAKDAQPVDAGEAAPSRLRQRPGPSGLARAGSPLRAATPPPRRPRAAAGPAGLANVAVTRVAEPPDREVDRQVRPRPR